MSKTVINSHFDADGISSAVLLMKAKGLKLKNTKVLFPKELGFGVATGKIDYMLDMHPVDDNLKCTVYDHHENPPYPPKEKRGYKLIYDEVPTALVIWNKHKDTIPESEWFKVLVGITGDQVPEVIPPIIIKKNPELLERITYGDFSMHKFEQLSSPINAAARFGFHELAFEELYKAKCPNDIIKNPVLLKYKSLQSALKTQIRKSWALDEIPKPFIIKNWCQVAIIDTEFGMNGYMASSMAGDENITTICINKQTGAISIRGTFTSLLIEGLTKHGITAGGHPRAAGGHIPKEKTYKDVIKIIKNIL